MIDLIPIPRPNAWPEGSPWEGYRVTSVLQQHLLNPTGLMGTVLLFDGSYVALNLKDKPVSGPHPDPEAAGLSLFAAK